MPPPPISPSSPLLDPSQHPLLFGEEATSSPKHIFENLTPNVFFSPPSSLPTSFPPSSSSPVLHPPLYHLSLGEGATSSPKDIFENLTQIFSSVPPSLLPLPRAIPPSLFLFPTSSSTSASSLAQRRGDLFSQFYFSLRDGGRICGGRVPVAQTSLCVPQAPNQIIHWGRKQYTGCQADGRLGQIGLTSFALSPWTWLFRPGVVVRWRQVSGRVCGGAS